MNLLQRIGLFIAGYSLLFFLLRTNEFFNTEVLLADIKDLGGVTYLYATVGIIFSILAGFIIQQKWEL